MRINNNIAAINTHRQYGLNNAQISKSTEKLSSGYRINRAGDDAAGLAISEKMRAQIRGLQMASKNSMDAVSLLQTAEGALQETHNILQRMRELAVQSASDSNESSIDRAALQDEFTALMLEIDDTAEKTRFNDMGIIDGSLSKKDAAEIMAMQNAVLSPYATVATNPINVTTGYNTVDILNRITTGHNSSFTNGAGNDCGKMVDFINGMEFLGETPIAIDGPSGNPNSSLTFSHGAVEGTFDISYKIDNYVEGIKVGEYEWKATVNKAAQTIELKYNGGLENHANGGSSIKFDITNSYDAPISIGTWAADNTEFGGGLGAWGSGRTATAKFLTDVYDEGTGTPTGTTYAGTPARPGSEVYNTVDTVTFNNGAFGTDANGNSISQANGLKFSDFSGEVPYAVAPSDSPRNASAGVNISHSPQNGKFLISIVVNGVEWNAHVDGNSTSFELINGGGPLNGGSSFVVSTPNGQTMSEWASTIGGMGAHGSGKTVTGRFSATMANNGTGSPITDGDPDDPGEPGDPGDPTDPVDPTNPAVPGYSGGFIVQTGANTGDQLEINIDRMDSGTLGIAYANVSSREYASSAISAVNSAINIVSTQRSKLGAMQNRLQHKINNLDISAENLAAAESRIRDIDMAKEMSNFTRANILAQASTAMLSQANQSPQNVLQLLG